MISLFDNRENCCGCEACSQICTRNIINMVMDNEGFYYPVIIHPSDCIECRQCERVCPIKHVEEINSNFLNSYAGWSKQESDIESSSSGGFASVLAEKAIEKNFIIYGVAFSEDCYSAEYIKVTSKDDLYRLKTSKYISSHKNNVYSSIRSDLKAGYKVVFFGLPCDTYALKLFVGKNDNLITVSLICHGPTSEIIQKEYVKQNERLNKSKATQINFRYKKNGNWKPYFIHVEYENGANSNEKFDFSEFDIIFQYFKRPSCHNCKFKNTHFAADILIGDFHSAQKGERSFHHSGVSSILSLTEKGDILVNSLNDSLTLYNVDLKKSISQKAIHSSVDSRIDRTDFINRFNRHGLSVACKQKDIRKELLLRGMRRRIMQLKIITYNFLKAIKIK